MKIMKTVSRLLLVFLTAASLYAGELHTAARHDAIAGTYVVSLAGDPSDPPALARELAAAYGGRLELYARAGSSDFAVRLSESNARALAADPRVTLVVEQERAALATAPRVPAPPVPSYVRLQPRSDSVPFDIGPYSYDAGGNIATVGADRFDYDGVMRVVRGTAGAGHAQSFTYDAAGNITSIVTDGDVAHTSTLAVDHATNRIDKAGNYTISAGYDTAGHQISDNSGNTYSYDGSGLLKESTVFGVHEVYLYGPGGERIAAVTLTSGQTPAAVTAHYTIRDETHAVLRVLDHVIASDSWSWNEDYVYAGSDLLAAETNGGGRTLHFFVDHLGSPRLITGSGGAKVAEHQYYPYGQEATWIQDAEVLKFGGHERDNAYVDYLHQRYANPVFGRFMTPDPVRGIIQLPQTWNRFAFAAGNPVNLVDPFGLSEKPNIATCGDASGGLPCVPVPDIVVTAKDPLKEKAEKEAIERKSALDLLSRQVMRKVMESLLKYGRKPDYINFSLGGDFGLGFAGNITVDRYGQIYFTPQLGAGVSATVVSASATAGWLIQKQKPSAEQLEGFLTGFGTGVIGGNIVGGGLTWGGMGGGDGPSAFGPGAGLAVEAGFTTAGVSVMAGYTFKLPVQLKSGGWD